MTHNIMFSTVSSLPYEDILPRNAWDMMKRETTMLIDVRTEQEWQQIGVADLSETPSILIKHSLFFSPDYRLNPEFAEGLMRLVPHKDEPLFFMCKVGGRSAKAAMIASELGYQQCYNILHGFEGNDGLHGWKTEGLPWIQA